MHGQQLQLALEIGSVHVCFRLTWISEKAESEWRPRPNVATPASWPIGFVSHEAKDYSYNNYEYLLSAVGEDRRHLGFALSSRSMEVYKFNDPQCHFHETEFSTRTSGR